MINTAAHTKKEVHQLISHFINLLCLKNVILKTEKNQNFLNQYAVFLSTGKKQPQIPSKVFFLFKL